LKVQLSDSAKGTRSPVRHPKRTTNPNGEGVAPALNNSDELKHQPSSTVPETNNSTSGSSENWMVLSITGDIPTPRFNHAAAVIGNKMVVVGGESGNGLLEDVQVLDLDRFSWTTASSKLYLSPSSLPLKIPACRGHSLVSWGKKALLIGGKTDPASDRISVWAFDTETECWSLMEAKGDIPAARSGHTVVRASSALILFGGEDAKRRKLNDLHMFDLKSLTWLPLHCTGPGPSARANHVAALYDDKLLLIFGGSSKSRTLNDLYSLDFETVWHAETLIFDVLKLEWSVASPSSNVTTNKGFSLVLVQHKERDYLVAFGGTKRDPSNQVEALIMEKNESSMCRRSVPTKGPGSLLSENRLASTGPPANHSYGAGHSPTDIGRQNLASVIEHHGSGRRSLSESLFVDPNLGNVSLRKQLHDKEDGMALKMAKSSEYECSSLVMEQTRRQFDAGTQTNTGGKMGPDEKSSVHEPDNSKTHDKHGNMNVSPDSNDVVREIDKSGVLSDTSSVYHFYETKLAALMKNNGNLEGQLTAALASRDAAEKNLSSALKSRQEIEKSLADTLKELELLRDKLATVELAQEEASSLSNIVHSDNVRLEHDVAFLKAVLDDTQKELHSTRGVLAGERARAFQLQVIMSSALCPVLALNEVLLATSKVDKHVEVFHLKQRVQSMENRAPTPRKPYHV
ncbi:hypothetical protein RJ639_013183, partial [Escallonia herrerae]